MAERTASSSRTRIAGKRRGDRRSLPTWGRCSRRLARQSWGALHLTARPPLSRWGKLTRTEEVEALLQALDSRGVRERDLKDNLQDSLRSIDRAFRAAAAEQARQQQEDPQQQQQRQAAAAALPLGIRASGRERKQAQSLYDPNKVFAQPQAAKRGEAEPTPEPQQRGGGGRAAAQQGQHARIHQLCNRTTPRGLLRGLTSALEEVAYYQCLLHALLTAQRAARVGMPVPRRFLDRLERLAGGEVLDEHQQLPRLQGHMQGCGRVLRELEEMLLKHAGQSPDSLDNTPDDEEGKVRPRWCRPAVRPSPPVSSAFRPHRPPLHSVPTGLLCIPQQEVPEEEEEEDRNEAEAPWLKTGCLEWLETDDESDWKARCVHRAPPGPWDLAPTCATPLAWQVPPAGAVALERRAGHVVARH